MSGLDQDQHLQLGCRDKTTVSSDSSGTRELAKQPLHGLKLASHAVLEKAQQRGRLKCSKCGGSRMFFCYTCCSLLGVSLQEIPLIKLPVKIDIIKHPNETDGKSTAIHAKILAPSDVTIYTYPCIPDFDKDKVVLVFPGPGSVSVQDMMQCLHDRTDSRSHDSDEPCMKRLKSEEVQGATHTAENQETVTPDEAKGFESRMYPLQRVVFIDSTWNQTNKISTDERLQDLLQVELRTRKTCFWRHQKGKPDSYLSTIEAIYYFLKDFHEHCLAQEYNGEYDNILFFYSYLHSVVNKAKISAGKC
ncbi:putative DTW domain-containing protein 1 isoform 5 [Scophthalmus maximus]|uniref:tRNA-uridine aminocarboxypropyltransferase 1 n=1 Tax=Scophthalmus maximus TaxID=52904 RepID=A0A2U9BBV1_SCOMX|nr:tRNA-uridine aminocarboxypropyltransferase 1 [Scophthalmus maximus]XP_035483257.1 tRNA-uridine aminocarboxypropyltransferase 1 [Scophthalmus maximus]AWP01374.1 putative DTW domain-containing protein 1 [Scophthalmus maximus]AWP01375.1 putative DTW domain-containing protein 1 isoform 2 [Scophthalmus maximus]AWP01376.1 putative DTW domain-containing protein 1 isoform 3 [Scophthalmus maximus]AWP01377.1 putative DTW domain-containing protein 1 isoform 4 [Scophthalmus maximus]AWP01378.1 putative